MFVDEVTVRHNEGQFIATASLREGADLEGIGDTLSEAFRDLADQLEEVGK